MEFAFIALKIEIVLLFSCNKDIESHKSTCKFTGPEDVGSSRRKRSKSFSPTLAFNFPIGFI